MNEGKEKIRELENGAMEKLVVEGWVLIEGNEFAGYLYRIIKGKKEFLAPDYQGGYYSRG